VTFLASAAEAARLDSLVAKDCAVPPILLMEGAVSRIWAALAPRAALLGALRPSEASGAHPLVALAGGGNNGADALAVLRLACFAGASGCAAILASRPNELCAVQLAACRGLGVKVVSWESERAEALSLIARARLLIDGIAGTGLGGPLRPDAAELVRAANAASAPIAAIDLPSGLGDAMARDEPLIEAEWTFSVEPRKACLYFPASREAVGEILPMDGVFPKHLYPETRVRLLDADDLTSLVSAPPASSHKGLRGRLAVFAGSPGMTGAAGLAVKAAYAASVGLVELHVDESLFPGLASGCGPASLAQAIIKPIEGEGEPRGGLRADALLVGPGWGQAPGRLMLLSRLLELGLPAVLDADGARLFGELLSGGHISHAPLILTPHPGEFEAISGVSADDVLANPRAILTDCAARWSAVIVFKSHVTWLAAPGGRLAVFDGREPSLATAGSGDVLAGLIAGILAGKLARAPQPLSEDDALELAWESAQAGVLAHGLSGRAARLRGGWYEAPAIAAEAACLLCRPSLEA
jgi:NAD(P)H-hydrate epimerase